MSRPFPILYVLALGLAFTSLYATRLPLSVDKLDEDEREYWTLAGRLQNGRFEWNGRRTLGAPVILAAFRFLGNDDIQLVQLGVTCIFCFSAPLTFLLIRRDLGSFRAAWLAGVGVAVWPLFVRYGGTLYSEPLALPFLLATLLLRPGPVEVEPARRRTIRWLLTGVMLGICMHIRPMYLLYAPILALTVVLQTKGLRRGLTRVFSIAIGCLIATLPWAVALSLKLDTIVPFSRNSGETFAGGMNPTLLEKEETILRAPDGRQFSIGPGKWMIPAETSFLSEDELRLSYAEQDKLLWQRAWKWAAGHPIEAGYITLRKWSYMWGVYPFWSSRSQTLLGNVPILILLVVGTVSLCYFRMCLRALSTFWLLPIFVSVVAMLSWGSWRFRQPGDLGLIVLAAALSDVSRIRAFLRGI